MRRKDVQIKDKSIMEDILNTSEYGTFALCKDNKPYSLPVNFVYIEDKVYFHGARKGKKKEYILANPLAYLSVSQPYSMIQSYFSTDDGKACPATHFFRSVFCDGEIKIVDDYDEKALALELLMQKLQPEGKYIPLNDTIYKKMINATEVFRFDITEMTCKIKLGQNGSKETFEKILVHLEERGSDIDKQTVKMMREFEK